MTSDMEIDIQDPKWAGFSMRSISPMKNMLKHSETDDEVINIFHSEYKIKVPLDVCNLIIDIEKQMRCSLRDGFGGITVDCDLGGDLDTWFLFFPRAEYFMDLYIDHTTHIMRFQDEGIQKNRYLGSYSADFNDDFEWLIYGCRGVYNAILLFDSDLRAIHPDLMDESSQSESSREY